MAITSAIPLEELRARYDALPPMPGDSGERRWFSRLMSWEDFVAFGPDSAELLSGADSEEGYLRPAAPELWDLLMEAWG